MFQSKGNNTEKVQWYFVTVVSLVKILIPLIFGHKDSYLKESVINTHFGRGTDITELTIVQIILLCAICATCYFMYMYFTPPTCLSLPNP